MNTNEFGNANIKTNVKAGELKPWQVKSEVSVSELNINVPNLTPCIYASQIGAILGVNKYQNVVDIVLDIWQRSYKLNFNRTVRQIERQTKVKYRCAESDIEIMMRLARGRGLHIEKEITECLGSDDIGMLMFKQQQIMKKVGSVMVGEDKINFERALKNAAHTSFGTKEEGSAVAAYEKARGDGTKVLLDSRFIKMPVYQDVAKHELWYVGGKIDGYLEDGTLIEVKNRMYRFFNRVRNYENAQIQTYLRILDLKKAHLVESLKTGSEADVNVLPVERNDVYWDNYVVPHLLGFIKFFHLFLRDDYMKCFILMGDKDDAEAMILNYIGSFVDYSKCGTKFVPNVDEAGEESVGEATESNNNSGSGK